MVAVKGGLNGGGDCRGEACSCTDAQTQTGKTSRAVSAQVSMESHHSQGLPNSKVAMALNLKFQPSSKSLLHEMKQVESSEKEFVLIEYHNDPTLNTSGLQGLDGKILKVNHPGKAPKAPSSRTGSGSPNVLHVSSSALRTKYTAVYACDGIAFHALPSIHHRLRIVDEFEPSVSWPIDAEVQTDHEAIKPQYPAQLSGMSVYNTTLLNRFESPRRPKHVRKIKKESNVDDSSARDDDVQEAAHSKDQKHRKRRKSVTDASASAERHNTKEHKKKRKKTESRPSQ